jgi:hypothetical protein
MSFKIMEGHMSQSQGVEPFAEYSALLDVQMQLHSSLQAASPDEAALLRGEIASVSQDIASLESDPDMPQSALRHGAALAHEVETLRRYESPNHAPDDETREVYSRRLRQVAAFALDRCASNPELIDDPRFLDVQAALGSLAADNGMPVGLEEGPSANRPELSPLETVDYEIALKNLRIHLGAITPGESYKLRPTEILTLAAPNMAFSRGQRYRLLCKARQILADEGYVFKHNQGRGRSSAYIVGRPAQASSESSAMLAA